LGATDYLLKPLDQAELVELLEQAQKRVQRWRQALAGTFNARGDRVPAAAG
jgi:YesN/AraC family two-component response regulator